MTAHKTSKDEKFLIISNKSDSPWARTMKEALAPLGHSHFVSEAGALAQNGQPAYDLIIIASGDIDGEISNLVKKMHEDNPEIPIVVTTNSPTWRRAREVFLAGATDYIRLTLDKNRILSFYGGVLYNRPSTPTSEIIQVNKL